MTIADVPGDVLVGGAPADSRVERLDSGAESLAEGGRRPAIILHERFLLAVAGALMTAGVVAIILGWIGAARSILVVKQIPYLISGGIGGLALLIIGAVFLGTEDVRRDAARLDRLEAMVEQLHAALLVADPVAADEIMTGRPADRLMATAADGVVVLPQGKSFHRGDCPMVEGKPAAESLPVERATSRGLVPCRLCAPQTAPA